MEASDLTNAIKHVYAQESGLDKDNPNFWEEYNHWRSQQPEPEQEIEYCPCCGQIIED